MYAIVDIETTGGHASSNGITEIAVYVHDGTEVKERYHSLINPGKSIPPYISALTGITDEMVAHAPPFESLASKLYELLAGKIFVAHNVNFDFSFLKHHFKLSGFDLQEKKLCTVRLSRRVFPGMPSYSLGNLCRELGIPVHDRHRADGDARATVSLFDRILMKDGTAVIDQMLKRNSGDQWLPLNIDRSVIDALPSCAGVYYFHNRKGKVIYVGKAVNVKRRVASHFTRNDPDPKRQHLLRQVHGITHKECASELHALILESTEIRKLWPVYNRSQKRPQQKFGLYSFMDGKGYMRLAIDQKKKHLPALYTFNWLHEGQVMLRKLVDAFDLDRRLCFLNEGSGEAKNPGRPHHYNSRVKKAIESLDQQLPTFALVDRVAESGKKLYLLVDRGAFWGMGYVDEKLDVNNAEQLKDNIEPFADNDFIRSSIFNYAELNPDCKVVFS